MNMQTKAERKHQNVEKHRAKMKRVTKQSTPLAILKKYWSVRKNQTESDEIEDLDFAML